MSGQERHIDGVRATFPPITTKSLHCGEHRTSRHLRRHLSYVSPPTETLQGLAEQKLRPPPRRAIRHSRHRESLGRWGCEAESRRATETEGWTEAGRRRLVWRWGKPDRSCRPRRQAL